MSLRQRGILKSWKKSERIERFKVPPFQCPPLSAKSDPWGVRGERCQHTGSQYKTALLCLIAASRQNLLPPLLKNVGIKAGSNSCFCSGPPQTPPPATVRANTATNIQTNKDTKFRLKPLFLEVVRSVDDVDPKRTVFTYEEVNQSYQKKSNFAILQITSLLSKYILSRKNEIFDTRNIKLALVEGDPLGKAFGVTAFHRCQVNALLRTQLIPVHPDIPLDQFSTSNNSAPNLSVPVVSAPASSSSSQSLPPFPALEKAASLPASFSNRRKRTNSTEKSEDETSRQQKQQRRADQCSVIIRRSEESESETETIYSEQGYETIKAEEENDEEASSGSDMDTTREVFEVEYDIDSGEEEERPPQVDQCWITYNWTPFNRKPQKWCSVIGSFPRSGSISQLNALPLEYAAHWIASLRCFECLLGSQDPKLCSNTTGHIDNCAIVHPLWKWESSFGCIHATHQRKGIQLGNPPEMWPAGTLKGRAM